MPLKSQQIEQINSHTVSCKGSNRNISEGHPKVWLKLSVDTGTAICPYCEKTFVFKKV